MINKASGKIKEYRRVLRLTKKPSKREFLTVVKVSAAGMAAIGLIGFLISLLKVLLIGNI